MAAYTITIKLTCYQEDELYKIDDSLNGVTGSIHHHYRALAYYKTGELYNVDGSLCGVTGSIHHHLSVIAHVDGRIHYHYQNYQHLPVMRQVSSTLV
jgi:hypothetical protein